MCCVSISYYHHCYCLLLLPLNVSTFISVSSLDFILLYLHSILHTAAKVIFIKYKNDHDLTPLHVCTVTTLRMLFPLIFEWLIPFYLDTPTFIFLLFKKFFDCAMWHMGS